MDLKGNRNFFAKFWKRNRHTPQKMNSEMLLDYFQSLAQHHPDLIIILSSSGEILSNNQESINCLLGYSGDRKLDYLNILSKRTVTKLRHGFQYALDGKLFRQNIIIQNKQDKVLYLEVTFVPTIEIYDERFVHLVVRDVTSNLQEDESVQLKKRHHVHAYEIAKIGSWTFYIEQDEFIFEDECLNIFGYDASDSVSKEDFFELIHEDDKDQVGISFHQLIKSGLDFKNQFRIYHNVTKSVRHIKSQAEVIYRDEKPYKVVGMMRDVTEQIEIRNELLENQEFYQHIFDNLNIGFWLQDYKTKKVKYLSNEMENIYGYSLEYLYDNPTFWEDAVLINNRDKLFQNNRNSIEAGESIQHRYQIISGDGSTKWVLDQTVPLLDEAGMVKQLYGMQIDITREVNTEEELKYISEYDVVTNLPNQRCLLSKLDYLLDRDDIDKFALLYIDLDNFSQINYSLGYAIGDEVLRKTANRLTYILNDYENSYLASFSGNDFIAVLPQYTNMKNVINLAEAMIQSIGIPLEVNEYDLHVTASVGISFYPENGGDKEVIIESAHTALYDAKVKGMNSYQVHTFTKDILSYQKYLLGKDLRAAIKEEKFEIYYQPIVNTMSGHIERAEALIRWHHDEWGIISPQLFISTAEENHLIHAIEDWVMKSVFSQLQSWKNQGIKIKPTSINISPLSLLKKDFVEVVQSHLNEYDISAEHVIFEISEESQLHDDKIVHHTLQNLSELGIKIAIDEFGSGHATLNYFKKFDIDILKIDKTFIRNIHLDDKRDFSIVSSIMYLANHLDINVIAEGVEVYEQYELLRHIECRQVQGYLFSKAVPVERFEKMLAVGYLRPQVAKSGKMPEVERRKYFRFNFLKCLRAEMKVTNINNRQIEIGSAQVLIENISLGGIKIYSTLSFPVPSNIKLRFYFTLMDESFVIDGKFVWRKESLSDVFMYGVEFTLSDRVKDRLANVINKMTVLRNKNEAIFGSDFIGSNPYVFFSTVD